MANYKAKKAGMNLAAQRKLDEKGVIQQNTFSELKYDAVEQLGAPDHIVEWMNATLGAEHAACPNNQWRKIHFWLRDGVALCKFINKIRQAGGMAPIKYQGNAHVAVVAQDNIDTFSKAAIEYGVPESIQFASLDLYEAHKGTLYKVIVFINALGNEANKKGFAPKYNYVELPQTNDVHT